MRQLRPRAAFAIAFQAAGWHPLRNGSKRYRRRYIQLEEICRDSCVDNPSARQKGAGSLQFGADWAEQTIMNPVKALETHGQAVWLDFLARGFTAKGDLKALIDNDGLKGVTSNPSIFEKAIG